MVNLNKKTDENIIREIEEYEKDYMALNKDRLTLFAVSFLESKKIEPTFDKIVVASFRLFPKKFSLIGFPEYPDGRTIYYCVYNHCTLNNKWLIGNVQSAFKVTEKGKYFVDETKKMLEGKIKLSKTHKTIPRRKEATFLAELKKTNAFIRYKQLPNERILKTDVFDALKAPINAKELAESHLEKYFDYAKRIGDFEVIKFLELLRKELGGRKNA